MNREDCNAVDHEFLEQFTQTPNCTGRESKERLVKGEKHRREQSSTQNGQHSLFTTAQRRGNLTIPTVQFGEYRQRIMPGAKHSSP